MTPDDGPKGLLTRWEEATDEPWYRVTGVILGLVAAMLVYNAPTPAGLPPDGQRVGAVALVMAAWWIGDVLPRSVTSMVPLVAFPLLGIQSMSDAAAPYAHPLIFLMLGGFVLGHAMEVVGLHKRLTAYLLAPEWVRVSPRRVVGALMVAAAALSGLVSNTATTLMMLPLAVSLSAACGVGPRARAGFVLALAYSASIGGLTTLVGTPPNAVLAGIAPEAAGIEVGFGQWMLIGIPMTLALLPAAWWAVAVYSYELPRRFPEILELPPRPVWTAGEPQVLAVAGGAMALWLTRTPKAIGGITLPGWGDLIGGKGSELDATVAVAAALFLFVLSVPKKEGGRSFLLDWQVAEKAIPWSVLLLLGGGFSLASAIKASGLTEWLAGFAGGFAALPMPVGVGLICLVMTFVTELTSNTATTQIALPVLAEAAVTWGVSPMMWLVPATISSSCAFMMPVATAPNAIAAEAGGVKASEMAVTGLVINLMAVVIVTVLSVLLVPWVFP